ncbi:hypothetical protein [Ichthyenterobacterium magnum]|uniref:YhhN-like protein n=1 Tax=Ichthyenterobacterium magnum TaxID=1230530 RepID=A0A420DLJ5_9FLAO|nr:hypothetical protein [Ichthyenterobacterium magnum]RKE95071.1 hypothetical protein BXY80_1254 [Ichthyenterobacterium magnum]
MQTKQILIPFLVVLSVVFLGFQFFEYEVEASGVRTLALLTLTALYVNTVRHKRFFFFMFLIFFTLAEILGFISWYVLIDYDASIDYFYYASNILYIMSYIFLIIRVIKDMNFRAVVSKLPIQILLLLILDVFCVLIVTGTTKGQLSFYEYSLEFVYNTVIMVLLSLALISYMYRDDKKSMNLLIGSIFIVFSEVIQLAYFYVSDSIMLNVICSVCFVFAFLFFYLQSILVHTEQFEPIREKLKV